MDTPNTSPDFPADDFKTKENLEFLNNLGVTPEQAHNQLHALLRGRKEPRCVLCGGEAQNFALIKNNNPKFGEESMVVGACDRHSTLEYMSVVEQNVQDLFVQLRGKKDDGGFACGAQGEVYCSGGIGEGGLLEPKSLGDAVDTGIGVPVELDVDAWNALSKEQKIEFLNRLPKDKLPAHIREMLRNKGRGVELEVLNTPKDGEVDDLSDIDLSHVPFRVPNPEEFAKTLQEGTNIPYNVAAAATRQLYKRLVASKPLTCKECGKDADEALIGVIASPVGISFDIVGTCRKHKEEVTRIMADKTDSKAIELNSAVRDNKKILEKGSLTARLLSGDQTIYQDFAQLKIPQLPPINSGIARDFSKGLDREEYRRTVRETIKANFKMLAAMLNLAHWQDDSVEGEEAQGFGEIAAALKKCWDDPTPTSVAKLRVVIGGVGE